VGVEVWIEPFTGCPLRRARGVLAQSQAKDYRAVAALNELSLRRAAGDEAISIGRRERREIASPRNGPPGPRIKSVG
jgi:hypothetical protein